MFNFATDKNCMLYREHWKKNEKCSHILLPVIPNWKPPIESRGSSCLQKHSKNTPGVAFRPSSQECLRPATSNMLDPKLQGMFFLGKDCFFQFVFLFVGEMADAGTLRIRNVHVSLSFFSEKMVAKPQNKPSKPLQWNPQHEWTFEPTIKSNIITRSLETSIYT